MTKFKNNGLQLGGHFEFYIYKNCPVLSLHNTGHFNVILPVLLQLLCKISKIMRKKDKKWPSVSNFGYYFRKICHGLSFYSWSSYFALLSSYIKITKLLKFRKWLLNCHFEIVYSQMLIRSLVPIAEQISQIKRKSDGTFLH